MSALKHSFHIPVMGIGYTLDTPIKVAKYGITSVVSIVADGIIEKARYHYAKEYGFPYKEISEKEPEYRSARITAYLNLLDDIVNIEFAKLKEDPDEVKKYFDLLPDSKNLTQAEMMEQIHYMKPGKIDVNIMTKLDRPDDVNPMGLTEASSALKGYAESKVKSSLVLSAGLNPRLFAFIEEFPAFFPDANGEIQKKIVVKVSDYRSSFLQGKMLAKKGIWVSEFRLESGLNCGGHTFATEGHLMGPILEEFKKQKSAMHSELIEMCTNAWEQKNLNPAIDLSQGLSVQGGIGSSKEQDLFLEHFEVDSTGWGSPFLLVPEATSIDDDTIGELVAAGEDDIYTSNISPLGVKFNTLRKNSGAILKQKRIDAGKPGSPCYKKHLALTKMDDGKMMCTASIPYQKRKIKQLKEQDLSSANYKREFEKITDKECICDGLGVSFLKKFNLLDKMNNLGVSICPGPNLAYFNRTYSLKEMVDHIYGRINIVDIPRPNVFLKELGLYVKHLQKEVAQIQDPVTKKAEKYLTSFKNNLLSGIEYYETLTEVMHKESATFKEEFLKTLKNFESQIIAQKFSFELAV